MNSEPPMSAGFPLTQPSPFSPAVPTVTEPATAAFPAFAGYGLEMEYMVVDRTTLDVLPMVDEMLRAASGSYTTDADRGPLGWSNELALHVLEIKNQRPQAALTDLAASFQAEVRAINALLAPKKAQLLGAGMHPWMDPVRETRIWSRERAELYRAYDRIFDCRRHGWSNIQSVHINLPFANDLEFSRLHAAARLVLPILPALAASSPYAEGRYTGFMDYRMEVYRSHQMQVPSTMGELIPDNVDTRNAYESRILAPMFRDMSIVDPDGLLQHEWLNARAAIPRFERDALEVRVLDVQECVHADFAIAAAAIALIRRFYEAGAHWLAHEGAMETRPLANILEACIRDADQTMITDPAYLRILGIDGKAAPAGQIWAELVEELTGDGSLAPEWRPYLDVILSRGPLARRLVDSVGRDPAPGELLEAYGEMARCLHEGRMYLG